MSIPTQAELDRLPVGEAQRVVLDLHERYDRLSVADRRSLEELYVAVRRGRGGDVAVVTVRKLRESKGLPTTVDTLAANLQLNAALLTQEIEG